MKLLALLLELLVLRALLTICHLLNNFISSLVFSSIVLVFLYILLLKA